MNYRFFIAWRYLFSKKSHQAINIISVISACGVGIATLAMVCTLSVFNGFRSLVSDLFTEFDPQLAITLTEGQTFANGDSIVRVLGQRDDVEVVSRSLEGQALVVKDGKQTVVTVKGMEDNFGKQMNLSALLYPLMNEDEPVLHADVLEFCIPGIQLAMQLNLRPDFDQPLQIYAPKRGERVNMANPMASFSNDELLGSGYVFQVKQSKYDANYLITSLQFAQRLFDQRGKVSQLQVKLKPGASVSQSKRNIAQQLGDRFQVKDRYEQQSDVFRIMEVEKLIAYLFLSFILLVASFNIVGSLSMLILDKKKDIETLHNLGAEAKDLRRIFIIEGNLISLLGALVGTVVGVVLCWVQQQFGIISMGQSEGAFIVESYPVTVHATDILLILVTVTVVSALIVWYPVRRQIS